MFRSLQIHHHCPSCQITPCRRLCLGCFHSHQHRRAPRFIAVCGVTIIFPQDVVSSTIQGICDAPFQEGFLNQLISSQASLIQVQITSTLTLHFLLPAVKVCSPVSLHCCHFLLRISLNGLFTPQSVQGTGYETLQTSKDETRVLSRMLS